MKRSSLSLALYLTLVFLSGAVVGAFGYRVYMASRFNARAERPKPEEFRQRYIEMMKKRLNLTDDQLGQLNVILDRTRDRFHALDEDVMKPQKQAIRSQQIQDITAILNEQQRAEYEKWLQERAERRKGAEERGERHKGAGEGGRPPRRSH